MLKRIHILLKSLEFLLVMKQLQAEKLMSIVGEYFPDLDPKICGMGLKSANYGVTVHTLSIRDRSEIDIHIVVPLSSAEKPFYVDQLNLFRDTWLSEA